MLTKKQIIDEIYQKGWNCVLKKEMRSIFKTEKVGKIIGQSRDKKCWKIMWRGLKTPMTYHKDFIKEETPEYICNLIFNKKRLDKIKQLEEELRSLKMS